MKILSAFAAGFVGAAAMLVAPTADAQRVVHRERHVTVTKRVVSNGNAYGHYRNRRVCRVHYRNHRRIRTCRTIRVRY